MSVPVPPLLSGISVGAGLKVLQCVLLFKKCRCDKMLGRIDILEKTTCRYLGENAVGSEPAS